LQYRKALFKQIAKTHLFLDLKFKNLLWVNILTGQAGVDKKNWLLATKGSVFPA